MNYRSPSQVAAEACRLAQNKVSLSIGQMLLLGILAGAYVAFAAWLYTVVTCDMTERFGMGFTKLVGASAFTVGLMMVIIGGAELFTGNCIMPLGVMAGYCSVSQMLRNWIWVFVANYIGSALVAALMYATGLWEGTIGANAVKIAAGKMSLPFLQAFARGIACNWIVVLTVWMSMAAMDIISKIGIIFFPIMAFLASGFEHSIANMYFLTFANFIKGSQMAALAGVSQEELANVTWRGFFDNMIPVTLGNIVGGVLFVACFYFLVYRRELLSLSNETADPSSRKKEAKS
ncbi:MAG TPA: formate/nitrite transporter family protein [Thermosynergistes sp.]|nr:formate/nitrite transporter family protein [Thermosynergistes sp.]